MTVVFFALLGLQGIAFAVWAFFMFKTLFLLRRRAVARTGRSFIGPIAFLNEIRHWLAAPADRRDRVILFTALLLLVVLVAITSLGVSIPAE